MAEIRALVVDNSPMIRRIVAHTLESAGCLVELAEDGLEALDRLLQQRFDIIFIDLIMPKIDGEKLGRLIRSTPEFRDIFMVILSGVALEDSSASLRIGADVCIAKGSTAAMQSNILEAVDRYRRNQRGAGNRIEGLDGLYPRQVTRELLISKRHRDIVLASMSEGVVELNNQGRIVMANAAALRLFGQTESQVLGMPLTRFLPEPAKSGIEAWLDEVNSGTGAASLSYDYEHALPVNSFQVTCNLVAIAENKEIFVIGILLDVTRRRQLEVRQHQWERERLRIRKLDAISVMASGIAHDFNNLLTIISGNIELAQYLAADERIRQLLQEAGKGLERTVQLVHRFASLSDNAVPVCVEVCLSGLIREVLDAELASGTIQCTVTAVEPEPVLELDPDRMRQIFVNLARNAEDAMGEEGTIRVRIDTVDGAGETARTGQSIPGGDWARVIFADSGPGLSPEEQDRAFDPYFSTKQKGTEKGMGLGLTIVHSIVKKHGGVVWIDSPPEGGCAVYLYFPLIRKTAPEPKRMVRAGAPRVLIMDDDEMMRMVDERMFEHCGCEVVMTAEGGAAVEAYQHQLEAGTPFDLVVLDLWVGEGMGGDEAARLIAALDPEAVLIAVSGDENNPLMQQPSLGGFADSLSKPFSIESIKELVQRFLVQQD
ncbi:MAG: response regulator [Desulfobulbus sp.]|jgi:PAS domain S-box-containing protein